MFSNLRQGTAVYVLELADKLILKEGKIAKIAPSITGGLEVQVKADGLDYEFKLIPYGLSIAKYNNAIVSETKDGILSEVVKLKETSEGIVDENNIKFHTNRIKECESLMRQLNPSYDKELKRDEEIDLLKSQMSEMSQSLANIEKLLSKNNN